MTVHFIGAGPGAADLITVRGLNLIKSCPVVLYAGSLVPEAVIAEAAEEATVVDTAPLDLDAIIDLMIEADAKGQDVARVHSGDPSLYGAICRADPPARRPRHHLDDHAGRARRSRRPLPRSARNSRCPASPKAWSSPGPPSARRPCPTGETLEAFARTGATLAIHLAINNLTDIRRRLEPILGADAPVVVVYRVSWPDQQIIHGTLATIRDQVKAAGITRTALVLIGKVLGAEGFSESRLYATSHTHVLRPKKP